MDATSRHRPLSFQHQELLVPAPDVAGRNILHHRPGRIYAGRRAQLPRSPVTASLANGCSFLLGWSQLLAQLVAASGHGGQRAGCSFPGRLVSGRGGPGADHSSGPSRSQKEEEGGHAFGSNEQVRRVLVKLREMVRKEGNLEQEDDARME